MNRDQTIRLAALSAITFLVGFIFINWFLSTRDIDHMPTGQMFTPAYVMAGITLVCTIPMPSRPIIIAPIAIGGILLGVAFDALTDQTMDHGQKPVSD